MKLTILLRDDEQLDSAGARIRYGRLRQPLEALGLEMQIRPLRAAPEEIDGDIVLLSKCQDARAPVLAQTLRGQGRLVGVDVFDDYFSDTSDSRLAHLRAWLDQTLGAADFALCATPVLADLLRARAPGLPVHTVNDPMEPPDWEGLGGRLEAKLERALRTRELTVCWFGMGDNPTFSVGLDDLHAYADRLAALRRGGFRPVLSILTNRPALKPAALARLARLPLDWSLEEWTESLEAEALDWSLCSFLPVNAQPFSAAKSLNRALTALTAGTQVLSPGHPLYARLAPFIYRDPERFLADIEGGTPALRPETVGSLRALTEELADGPREAARLVGFLRGLRSAAAIPPCLLLHGSAPPVAAHKLAQRLGILSVASPFSFGGFNNDVQIDARSGRPYALLSQAATDRLAPSLAAKVEPNPSAGHPFRLDLSFEPRAGLLRGAPDGLSTLARYALETPVLTQLLADLFPGVEAILAEERPPFPVLSPDAGRAKL